MSMVVDISMKDTGSCSGRGEEWIKVAFSVYSFAYSFIFSFTVLHPFLPQFLQLYRVFEKYIDRSPYFHCFLLFTIAKNLCAHRILFECTFQCVRIN